MASPIGRLPSVDLLGFSGPGTSGGRSSSGQFAISWPNVAELNKKMAQRLQASVLAAFDDSLSERPQRPTRYLRKALASDGAIAYNLEGFAFLPQGYLDAPQTIGYWRNLETGTSKFEGRVLGGYFLSASGTPSSPSQERYGLDERFAGRGGSARSGRGAIVQRAIQPHEYLKNGVRNWQGESGITPLTDALKTIRITPV